MTTRFDRLVEENLRWLRGWLGARLRGRERQEVDDLCQDILLKALRGFPRLRDPSRFSPWLYRIATNVLRDHLRRVKSRRQEILSPEIEIEDPSSRIEDLERREEVSAAMDAVLSLPPKFREPMLLRHVDDLSGAEIAEILGISENAVQVRMFRARERLRETSAYRRLAGTPEPRPPDRPPPVRPSAAPGGRNEAADEYRKPSSWNHR